MFIILFVTIVKEAFYNVIDTAQPAKHEPCKHHAGRRGRERMVAKEALY